jgi:hypothetical protein
MARDPNSIIRIDYNELKSEVLKIENAPEFDIPDYDLTNPKEFPKYISSVEKICRGSFEYKLYVNFLRDYVDMNKCSFYQNVTNADSFKIKIHIHHEPITLFDITLAVYNKRCAFRESISDEMVAKEVIYNHYKMNIGLIPLAETVHELVHNKYLFVPTTSVFGMYKTFIETYKDFVDPETMENIRRAEMASVNYSHRQAESILNTNMIYIDPSGAYKLPKHEEVMSSMKERVEELKNTLDSTR